jgi:hypothetical protein
MAGGLVETTAATGLLDTKKQRASKSHEILIVAFCIKQPANLHHDIVVNL